MVATRPLDCKQQATVAVICLVSDKGQRKGERTDRWLGLARPIIKYNPSLLYENSFCLGKQGECLGSLGRDKGCKSPEMVCKTPIVFSDEYSAINIPNARNSERDTKPIILYRKVSVRYFTTTMSNLVKVDLLAASEAGNLKALALSNTQIDEKLRPVPVFTITDATGAPLIASVPKKGEGQSGNDSVAGIFISQQDAQAFVDRLKTTNPQLAASVRVMPVSLGEIYQISQANKGKPEEVQFSYVPAQQQVQSAKTVLQQTGQ
jgi:hypothetical protein